MRKYVSLIMLIIIALILVSCSSGSPIEPTEPPAQAPVANETPTDTPTDLPKPPGDDPGQTIVEGKLAQVYQDMMKNGKYTMKYKTTMSIEGNEREIEITLAVLDGMTAMIMDSDEFETTTLFRDEAIHLINHETRTIMIMPEGLPTENEEISPDDLGQYDMVYVGSGREDFMGKDRKYEEYAVEDGSIKYYFDGDDLDGMKMVMGDNISIMEIEEMSNTVNESLFELPSGYQEIKLGG